MNPVELARWQFAITTIYHFLFVPLTIGMVLLIAVMETIYVRTGRDVYKKMAEFWGKLFLINFAVGVVTGILQEFQFGMNWSAYSRFVGDVFGAPLAIEGLLAFFMESTFIGLWLFGRDRISKRLHLASIWLVAAGTVLSAFWILTANSFMQEPVGFTLRNGRAEMSDFLGLLTNPQLWVEFPHTVLGAFATGAFFIAGVSAWQILRQRHVDLFRRSFQIAIPVAMVSSILVALVGHEQAQHLVQAQPMKMAASEALWNTSPESAPWTVFALIDEKTGRNTMEVQVPHLLSILAYNRIDGQVEGINQLQQQYVQQYGPGNYVPPVQLTFWSFRIMVLAGTLMILLGLYGSYLVAKRKLANSRRYLQLMVPAAGLPFVANISGWVMTEVGRQPWTVFGFLKTVDSVSPAVSPGEILFTLISFTAMYGILAAVDIFLFVRTIRRGPDEPAPDVPETDPFSEVKTGAVAQ
ncbi:cytochrome ubiquinol oxidase subunit I [Kyrpidia tusciae]|uniref:Cytochrome bd ubiquinol oxidase subunit I n=1 Tax=Kyrpidia tusciae (strain DSM 2912 / NBRC 15312 / T2) TaxID=562970 RepID=D5WRV6_KYRT2|nr:cytochrome ubiquinol oxidase subunit I [Kyrpidia tusciae]ADG06908.1 cytochrome bd ubiquinol oxidase subunit I [Kyrpidia tusciae DSM 2912]